MTLLWEFAQLVFWLAVCAAIVGAFLLVVLAPPFFVGRAIWRRYA